jgi:hypothetical protein
MNGSPKLVLFRKVVDLDDGGHEKKLVDQILSVKITKPCATTALEYYSQNVLNRVSATDRA